MFVAGLFCKSGSSVVLVFNLFVAAVLNMAESVRSTVSVVPLNSSKYATWKIQAKMTLLKEGLWKIVDGTEVAPDDADALAKFVGRSGKALATLVLSVEPSLLYLIGESEDPSQVWKKLSDQFCKNTWNSYLGDEVAGW